MGGQVFLGGAAGATTWRRDVAIPLLEAAGVSYYDPQLGVGEWSPACEAAEMAAKDGAEVLLFVLSAETRGVATVGEMAYYLGAGWAVALSIVDVEAGALVDERECEDLNRGRIFVRTMARELGVPVFADVGDAVREAIRLVKGPLDLEAVRGIVGEVNCGPLQFRVEASGAGYLLYVSSTAADADTGDLAEYTGRRWFIGPEASRGDVVRTALKAALTWAEHETREAFLYRGRRVFGPHIGV